ncbi:hypothetical protein [Flammeovirga aprica]|uniref:Uncharacterized protein n=1 Tax=Flammeovirga aprica JL-4 TaxID=694437 RepID=A0A7X9S1T3_9BACT|nr:hypothetical protein [Flammeovirga aprica]NME72714.1 hypothetical protein [Flammeovirga aprica JL-4]
MKKVFLSATGIAVAFMAFAFTPVQKNNSMGEMLDTQTPIASTGTCSTKMQTSAGFTRCDNTWEEKVQSIGAMTDVLNKY